MGRQRWLWCETVHCRHSASPQGGYLERTKSDWGGRRTDLWQRRCLPLSAGWLRAQSRVDSATLPVECNFLARKLGPDAVLPIFQLYTDCDSKLGIIPCNSSTGGQTSWEQVLGRWLPGR